jgi:hypothetical protein
MVCLTSSSTLPGYELRRREHARRRSIIVGLSGFAPPDSRSPGGLYNDSTSVARFRAIRVRLSRAAQSNIMILP